MSHPRRSLCVAVLASALVTSACGLKQDVKDQLATGGGGTGGVDTGLTTGTGTTGTDGSTTGTSGTGTTGGSGTSGTTGTIGSGTSGGSGSGGSGTTTGGSGTGGSGTTTGGSGAAPQPGVGNTTGIDFKNKTIKVVLHGPLTGAGVPQESFRTGGPKYWDKSGPNGGPRLILGGFRVITEAVDDKYNAQDALRACNSAAKTAFLIMGGAGTDQIQACGQSPVLARGNVPYLSAGVTEAGLDGRNNYFATSLTYRQQSPLVIRAARDNGFLNKKWAVVITGTPNFRDARESIVSELQKAGAQGRVGAFNPDNDVYLTEKAPSNCTTLGSQLRAGGYETVYFLGQPLFFGLCVREYPSAVYTGPGPSFGIQSVADLACRGASTSAGSYKGFYLHPAPDKDTAQARAKGAPPFTDDIEGGIWGAMQGLEAAFNLVKGPLSRESFIQALAASRIPDGVAPGAVFNGQTRFGGTAALLNKITCASPDKGRVQTIATYKK
jgi:branched-chain amino acid transport system substrate-binding protein